MRPDPAPATGNVKTKKYPWRAHEKGSEHLIRHRNFGVLEHLIEHLRERRVRVYVELDVMHRLVRGDRVRRLVDEVGSMEADDMHAEDLTRVGPGSCRGVHNNHTPIRTSQVAVSRIRNSLQRTTHRSHVHIIDMVTGQGIESPTCISSSPCPRLHSPRAPSSCP